jgi:hypothetical protein
MHSKDGQQTNRGDTAMKRRTDNLIEYHIQCLLGFVYFNQLYHLSKQNETVSKKCTRFGREIEVSLDIEAKLFGIKVCSPLFRIKESITQLPWCL